MGKCVYVADTEAEKGFNFKADENYLMNTWFMIVEDFKTKEFERTIYFRNAIYEITENRVIRTIIRTPFDNKRKAVYPDIELDKTERNYFFRNKDILKCYKKIGVDRYRVDLIKEYLRRKCNLKNFGCLYFHNLDYDFKFLFDNLPKQLIKRVKNKETGKLEIIRENYEAEPIQTGGRLISFRLFVTYNRNYFKCRKCLPSIRKKNKKRPKNNKLEDKFKINKYGKSLICPICKSNKDTFIPTYTKTALELRDSYALLVSSAEKIGETLKLNKLKVDYNSVDLPTYEEYCRRDNDIIRLAIQQLIDFTNKQFEFDINDSDSKKKVKKITIDSIPLTLPALSKRCWIKLISKDFTNLEIMNFMKVPQFLTDLMRSFYFGGRVEVFNFNICLNGAYNDFNSFYPAQMYKYKFPIPPYRYKKLNENSKFALQFALSDKNVFGVIAEVTEDLNIPLIPVRLDNGKIIFPTGKKLCFLFKDEIKYLRKLNQKIEIKYLYYSAKREYIFKSFIEKTYFRRKINKETYECLKCDKSYHLQKKPEDCDCDSIHISKKIDVCDCGSTEFENLGDNYFSYLLKIFMNSLYGKFAERETKEVLKYFYKFKDAMNYLKNKQFITKGMKIKEQNEIIKQYLSNEMFGSLPLVKFVGTTTLQIKNNIFFSMFITAMSRLELHQALVNSKTTAYYCDTDSCVTNKILEDSVELGRLKPEFIFKKFQAFSCKEYAVEIDKYKKQSKMKGFSLTKPDKEADNDKDKYKDIPSISKFAEQYLSAHKQFRPAKLKEIMNRNLNPNEVVVFEKFKSSFYDKRWINEDFTTKPFHLQNDSFEKLKENNAKRLFQLIAKLSHIRIDVIYDNYYNRKKKKSVKVKV